MMYNMAGCYLAFFQWLQMTTIEKRIDLFTEISCVKFALLRFPYTFKFQLT